MTLFGLQSFGTYVTVPLLLCFTLYLRAISKYKPLAAYVRRGDLTEGFLRYEFGALIFGGAYPWRGLFSEFYGRLHVAVHLFSNRSQMTSKCGKNKEVALEPQASVSLMFLTHFDVFCDQLLNTPTTTWNLFVLSNDRKRRKTDTHTCLAPLDCLSICASLGSI